VAIKLKIGKLRYENYDIKMVYIGLSVKKDYQWLKEKLKMERSIYEKN